MIYVKDLRKEHDKEINDLKYIFLENAYSSLMNIEYHSLSRLKSFKKPFPFYLKTLPRHMNLNNIMDKNLWVS